MRTNSVMLGANPVIFAIKLVIFSTNSIRFRKITLIIKIISIFFAQIFIRYVPYMSQLCPRYIPNAKDIAQICSRYVQDMS